MRNPYISYILNNKLNMAEGKPRESLLKYDDPIEAPPGEEGSAEKEGTKGFLS